MFEGLKELLNSPKPEAALLYGVTGSGKTQVFLHLINETGYIAYCLQTAMESPNNSSYSKIYWWD